MTEPTAASGRGREAEVPLIGKCHEVTRGLPAPVRTGKLQANKRGFSLSQCAPITFQGRDLFKSPLYFHKKNTYYLSIAGNFLAERGGFEPPVRNYRTPAFQASTLNHSDISPCFNA